MLNTQPVVLLLDDYADTLEVVTAWLSIEGWRAIAVRTAEEALSVLGRERVDAVVMEPHLRSGSAMHVAEAARALASGCPLMISMSASGRAGDAISYEPTLFDFNLVKPVPMSELARVLSPARKE